jgi:hypothetical protein
MDEGSFAVECDPLPSDDSSRPRVVLWGDSHAAALYPGLKSFSDQDGFALAEYTAGGCPPILDFISENRPLCSGLNSQVIKRIASLKPDLIVVGAYWALYDGKSSWGKVTLEDIQHTIDYVASLGVKHVALVGTLPVFDDDHPKISAKLFRPFIKNRTYQNFHDISASHNDRLKSIVLPAGSTFISPTELLCTEDGCLISASQSQFDPMNADSGHLTLSGSRLLISLAIEKRLLILPRYPLNNPDHQKPT